jgi:hypothetical protein
MESKKKFKKRTINEYRQVKDSVYRSPHKDTPLNNSYYRLYEDLKDLCRKNGNDQELGGAVRRTLRRFYEAEQHRR